MWIEHDWLSLPSADWLTDWEESFIIAAELGFTFATMLYCGFTGTLVLNCITVSFVRMNIPRSNECFHDDYIKPNRRTIFVERKETRMFTVLPGGRFNLLEKNHRNRWMDSKELIWNTYCVSVPPKLHIIHIWYRGNHSAVHLFWSTQLRAENSTET